MSSGIIEAVAAVVDACERLSPSQTATMETIVESAPAYSEVHRLASRMWECRNCWRRGTLKDLFLCVEGDSEAACPRCLGDNIVMLQEPEAVQ